MDKATSVDEYLRDLPKESRSALEELRSVIRSAVPAATEGISYGMPAFKLHNRSLLTYAAFKDHCSLFPMSKKVIADHKKELAGHISGEGTIRFTTEEPLPVALVRKIVKARIKEVEARANRP
jgi:uncharacterized protein YdhG (YjbR/CyaY superfamily)